MAGYYGWSMSNNARAAYNDSEMPKSKWTKQAMLARIAEFLEDYDIDEDLTAFGKMPKPDIFDRFFISSSWHHTSKFYNITDFYKLHERSVAEFLGYENSAMKLNRLKTEGILPDAASPGVSPAERDLLLGESGHFNADEKSECLDIIKQQFNVKVEEYMQIKEKVFKDNVWRTVELDTPVPRISVEIINDNNFKKRPRSAFSDEAMEQPVSLADESRVARAVSAEMVSNTNVRTHNAPEL